jgi:hypothetical protein
MIQVADIYLDYVAVELWPQPRALRICYNLHLESEDILQPFRLVIIRIYEIKTPPTVDEKTLKHVNLVGENDELPAGSQGY